MALWTGRLILIKSVLMDIPVYWITLTCVAKGVLAQIKKICGCFLCIGSKEEGVFPWVSWEKIAIPKTWGGWGIKDLPIFTSSLAAKYGQRLLTLENLWTVVVKRKYIDP